MAASKWTDAKRWKAIELYISGKTHPEIAKALSIPVETVRPWIAGTYKAFYNIKASKGLNQHSIKNLPLQNPELTSKLFQDKLSAHTGPLTTVEVKFCWSYVASADYFEAMETSGLDEGLFTDKQLKGGKRGEQVRIRAESYLASVRMRIAYLKSKQNIIEYIQQLMKASFMDSDIGKPFLQKTILTRLENLKATKTPDAAKLERDYVTMLGKTFGGFTEKIDIGIIDHSKSVKMLHEHANSAETMEELRRQKEEEKIERERIIASAVRTGSEDTIQ